MPIKSNTLKLSINREYDIKLYTSNKWTQFQNGILIFGCAITEIPGKANDVTSLHVAFWDFLLSYVKISVGILSIKLDEIDIFILKYDLT